MTKQFNLFRAAVWLVVICGAVLGGTARATAGWIYWLDDIGIQRANLDGSGVETVVAGARTRAFGESPLLLDSIHNRIYWTGNEDELFSVNLDGSDRRSFLIPGLGYPRGLALDAAAGTIYFSTQEQIDRVNLDGTGLQRIVEDDIPFAVAVDPAGGKVYWGNPYHGLRRANIDGTEQEALVDNQIANQIAAGSLVLDTAASRIYWAARDLGENIDKWIWTSGLDGSDAHRMVMLPSPGFIHGLTLDSNGQTLYWSDRFNGEIFAYDIFLDSANALDNPRRIVSGLEAPVGIIFVVPEPSGSVLWTVGAALVLLGNRHSWRGRGRQSAPASYFTAS